MVPLIICVGNSLRGDDGVGERVAQRLGERAAGRFHVMQVLSVLPELAAELVGRSHVIFVDADVRATAVELGLVTDEAAGLHRFALSSVVALARALGFSGTAWACRLPVDELGFGEGLSAKALRAADEAVDQVMTLMPGATLQE